MSRGKMSKSKSLPQSRILKTKKPTPSPKRSTTKVESRGKKKISKASEIEPLIQNAATVAREFSDITKQVQGLSEQIHKGDVKALLLLIQIGALSCEALHMAIINRPEMVSPIIQGMPAWPVMWMKGDHFNKELTKAFNAIGLGSKCNVAWNIEKVLKSDITPKQVAFVLQALMQTFRECGHFLQNMANRRSIYAEALDPHLAKQLDDVLQEFSGNYDTLRRNYQVIIALAAKKYNTKETIDDDTADRFIHECVALPELSKDTCVEWKAAARMILRYLTDEHPEKNVELKKLRIGTEVEPSRVRAAIIESIMQSFENQLNLSMV